MKLLDSLYTITSDCPVENGHEYEIKLNPEHTIYKAHFPGEPITPGVCILQIAIELLEQTMKASIKVNCVKNIKFLRIVSPEQITEVKYSLQKITKEEGGALKLQVVVTASDETYAKMSLECSEI